jgi:precorrin-6A/cobalt-precorrin-6A reductase
VTGVLLLAGTAEARTLAAEIAGLDGLEVTASLAGVTRQPESYPVPVRIGGFGGVPGLIEWLEQHRPAAVIDATHPYATQMQAHAVNACTLVGTPRLRLLRPAWPARTGWTHVPDLAAAAQALPSGARVLLTTGRKDIAPFAARPDVQFVLRTIEPLSDLPAHITSLIARPPFTPNQEREAFTQHGITHLVTKNAGGTGTAKLDAADSLSIRTIVVDRPPTPPGSVAETVAEAVAWLRKTVGI